MKKAEIEEKANEILSTYANRISDDSFVDIVSIAEDMGFTIGQAALAETEDGFIIVNDNKKNILGINTSRLIVVNKNRNFGLRRFIIAHELGHHVFSDNKTVFAHREHKTGKGDLENSIDYFAACLLMPKENFIKKYMEYEKAIKDRDFLITSLTKLFGVTYITCERRVEELGLK